MESSSISFGRRRLRNDKPNCLRRRNDHHLRPDVLAAHKPKNMVKEEMMKKLIAATYTILYILVLLDILSTVTLLKLGGVEQNVLASLQWQMMGLGPSIVTKICMVSLLGLLIGIVENVVKTEKEEKLANRIMIVLLLALTGFYVYVVANNLFWLAVAKGVLF